MKRLITSLILLAGPAATADTLTPGSWKGTLEPVGRDAFKVEYEVKHDEQGNLEITLYHQDNPFPFQSIRLKDNGLRFHYNPGKEMTCELHPDEQGAWKGACKTKDGAKDVLTLTMKPIPAENDPGGADPSGKE